MNVKESILQEVLLMNLYIWLLYKIKRHFTESLHILETKTIYMGLANNSNQIWVFAASKHTEHRPVS